MSALLPSMRTDKSVTLLEAKELRLADALHGRLAESTRHCAKSASCTCERPSMQLRNINCVEQRLCLAGPLSSQTL